MSPDASPAAGETIGERLKRLRLERGFSQRELAAPGVSYAYISRIEAGTRQPSVKALRKLAAKLGVSAEYLETGSDLAPEQQRELRLADLELAVRLGDSKDTEASLQAVLDEALAAGDPAAALRARVALATLALGRSEWVRSAELLEAALEDEPFSPIEKFDIYARLGHSYAESGRSKDAVELYERCVEAVADADDAALEARYAALLSYALSDMGDLARAEDVLRRALGRLGEQDDPYMRVRLYWSIARLAHREGRASVALANVRKAIALLQATDDTLHLARAHILAAGITLSRSDADDAARHLDNAERLLGMPTAVDDLVEVSVQRSRIAAIRGEAEPAIAFARRALDLNRGRNPVDDGRAFSALADGLTLAGDTPGADEAYHRAVDLLEEHGRWRDAANACRAQARMLRQAGDERQAMDVLDRAAELGTRGTPAEAHAER